MKNRSVNLKLMTQIWQVSKSQDSGTELRSYYVIIIKLKQTFILVQFVTKKYKVYFVIRTYNTDGRDYEIVFLRQ
jgi:hypothetical protein